MDRPVGGRGGHLVERVEYVKGQEGWHSGGSGPFLVSFPSQPGSCEHGSTSASG